MPAGVFFSLCSKYFFCAEENYFERGRKNSGSRHGEANYLEVLTAQESYLSAQLNEAENIYDGAQAVIALYIALGGARE